MKNYRILAVSALLGLLALAGCGGSTSSNVGADEAAKQAQINQQGVNGAAKGAPVAGAPGMGGPGMGGPGMAVPGR